MRLVVHLGVGPGGNVLSDTGHLLSVAIDVVSCDFELGTDALICDIVNHHGEGDGVECGRDVLYGEELSPLRQCDGIFEPLAVGHVGHGVEGNEVLVVVGVEGVEDTHLLWRLCVEDAVEEADLLFVARKLGRHEPVGVGRSIHIVGRDGE